MSPKSQTRHQDPNKDDKNKRFPFDQGKKNMKDNIVDGENNLVYEDKRWKDIDQLSPKYVDKMKKGKSPLTRMEESGICDGVIHLTGAFVKDHKDEIINTIENSEKMAEKRNAMNKIQNIEYPSTDSIIVYTVKNQLAVTLGKKIDQSFKGGKLEIVWSKDDQPVEVKWHKD